MYINMQGSSRHSIFSKKRKCSNDKYRYVFETLEVNSIQLSHKSMVFALQTRQFSNPYTLKWLEREITFSLKIYHSRSVQMDRNHIFPNYRRPKATIDGYQSISFIVPQKKIKQCVKTPIPLQSLLNKAALLHCRSTIL